MPEEKAKHTPGRLLARLRKLCRCSFALIALRLLSNGEYVRDFLWDETPYPAGDCEHISPPVWREVRRLILYRLTLGRCGRWAARAEGR
jgi:hypothetical protein